MYRRSIAPALASATAAAAAVLPPAGRETAAFAAAPIPLLHVPRHTDSAACSTFVNALVREGATTDSARTKPEVTMMASRRNLKKEKRARNEFYARQFRKAPPPRFARAPGGAARSAQEQDDGKWLEQIYGQHSIFRRETVTVVQDPAVETEAEAKASSQASVASEQRTLVAA